MAENKTLQNVGIIAGLVTIGWTGYQYIKRKETEETIKSEKAIVKSDSINSAKSVMPTIDDVKKILAANPKAQTYSFGEYKNFASSLYEYFKNNNLAGLVTVFDKMKTKADLMLLNIYYAVKVFKSEDYLGNFSVKTYNLSQSLNNLTNDTFRTQLSNLFKKRNINYNLF